MHCHLYLRNHIVYIPTMGKMGKGFYRGVEPVAVVSASNTEALRQGPGGDHHARKSGCTEVAAPRMTASGAAQVRWSEELVGI
jgi:hypothetical protein